MISKPFELQNHLDKKIFLLYGENNGQKEEVINKFFKQRHLNSVYNYSEKEVFLNLENFYNQINSQSFFEDKKLIIINYVSEKFKEEILNLLNKNLEGLTIILITGILEKKSKIRNLFEKEKDLIIVPFYKDNDKTLADIARIFFNEREVSVSQETINIISQKASGDRKNLKNELEKIENFLGSKKKLNTEDALKLTNLSENYSIKDLVNNCLAKNQKGTLKIINENVFVLEDCISITRSILIAANRLLKLLQKKKEIPNLEQLLVSYKPPIFWKERPILKEQINNWSEESIKKLIYKTDHIELMIKKNNSIGLNIILDFLIEQSSKANS